MAGMRTLRLRSIARAYLISIAFWSVMALLMGLQNRPLNLWPSYLDLLVQVEAHALPIALWTPPIFYLVGKHLSSSRRRFLYLLLWGLGAPVFVLLHMSTFWLLLPPYDDALQKYVSRSISSWLELIRTGFAEDILIYIAIVVAAHGYEYWKRLRREEAERSEYQRALAASELQALKMQLHPHFLFNTLHGIATLAESDPRNAKAMIIKLSNLLRTSLDRDSSDLIPLEGELKFVREYLDLEKMRLGSRLKVEWRVDPGTSHLLVPQMILQPLVENAIRHGIASSREAGWVEVATSTSNGTLNIQVRNSTAGRTSDGTGVGLRNVEARLRYLYSGDATLRFAVTEDCTATVSLALPALNFGTTNVPGRHVHASPEE